MNQRIIHDCSHQAALQLLKTIAHLLREEEQRDAYGEFYCIVKEALTSYARDYDHVRLRLYGSNPN